MLRLALAGCVVSLLFHCSAACGQVVLQHTERDSVPERPANSAPAANSSAADSPSATASSSIADDSPPRAASSPVIVIGFVGGFVRHDDLVHASAQLGARLRSEYPAGVAVQVFENHREDEARREVLKLLDADHDGTLSTAEKQNARIVIYGHSWGASETVNLARQLGADGIPVLLTIQVDSISKSGEDDGVIPANVGQAANFYQPDGILHGRPEIRAADPAHTKILGNFRFDYKANPVRCEGYPLRDRILTKTHTEIECDPKVWSQVEALIREKLGGK